MSANCCQRRIRKFRKRDIVESYYAYIVGNLVARFLAGFHSSQGNVITKTYYGCKLVVLFDQLDGIFITAIHAELAADRKTIYVEREVEGGSREVGDIRLPALLTIQTGINTPRYPALSKLLRANNQVLAVVETDLSAGAPAPQTLIGITLPEKMRVAVFLKGSTAKKAEQLFNILRERSLMS